MGILEIIGIVITLLIAVVGAIITIYEKFTKPDNKAKNEINLIKQGCDLKHNSINGEIKDIKKNISLIKENHLRHIENDIKCINNTQTKILTILESKYQIKINNN